MFYHYQVSYEFNGVHGRCANCMDVVLNFEIAPTDIQYIEQLIGAELLSTGEWKQPQPEVISYMLRGSAGDEQIKRSYPVPSFGAKLPQPWHQRRGNQVTTVRSHKQGERGINQAPRAPGQRLVGLDGGRPAQPKRHLHLVTQTGQPVKPALRLVAPDGRLVDRRSKIGNQPASKKLRDQGNLTPPCLVAVDGQKVGTDPAGN